MSQPSAVEKRPRIKPNRDMCATLSPRASCEVTGFGIAETYRMLHDGLMPHIKSGRKFYIPKAALLRWLENAGSKEGRSIDTQPKAE
jgi:excisionase family DNA binding protein